MNSIRKYPRTRHLLDSRPQPGDEDLRLPQVSPRSPAATSWSRRRSTAPTPRISFDRDGRLRLQSRGHYLTGGPRERHFALFKGWAATMPRRALGARSGIATSSTANGSTPSTRSSTTRCRTTSWSSTCSISRADRFLATPERRRLLGRSSDLLRCPCSMTGLIVSSGGADGPGRAVGLQDAGLARSARRGRRASLRMIRRSSSARPTPPRSWRDSTSRSRRTARSSSASSMSAATS